MKMTRGYCIAAILLGMQYYGCADRNNLMPWNETERRFEAVTHGNSGYIASLTVHKQYYDVALAIWSGGGGGVKPSVFHAEDIQLRLRVNNGNAITAVRKIPPSGAITLIGDSLGYVGYIHFYFTRDIPLGEITAVEVQDGSTVLEAKRNK